MVWVVDWVISPHSKSPAISRWNVTILGRTELELVQEVERYQVEIVGLTFTHIMGSGAEPLQGDWTIHYSGVAQGEWQQAGVDLFVAPQLSQHTLKFTRLNERVTSLHLWVPLRK